jgi:pimeloyl-ACP methyl ester carboxylesterase
MADSTYPRQQIITPSWEPYQVRQLLTQLPPPEIPNLPFLPSQPRQPAFDAPYTLTTHILPAAYPRTSPDVPLQQLPPDSASKSERKRALTKIRDDIMKMHEDVGSGKYGEGSKKVLWNCVNRYVRNDLDAEKATGGVTLFFTHANGFPKEIWEATLKYLLSTRSDCELIDEIWSWEAVQHGDAGLLNSKNLGGIYDWSDNARDILNFLLHFIPTTATASPLPTHLTRVSAPETEFRKRHGFPRRSLVTIGHSFGGCSAALAAINFPALFSSIMLIDPVIVRPRLYHGFGRVEQYVLGALQRRERWPSHAEALRLLSQNPFFAAWDPDVLKLYVECALTSDPDGSVRLKMTGLQEALVFVESRTPYEVFTELPKLDERIELRWLIPGKDHGIGGLCGTQVLVWRRPNNASNIRIPHVGHLVSTTPQT